MKEKDIHDLIERQNPEVKQLIWEKILSNLPEHTEQTTITESNNLDKNCKSKRGKAKSPR